MIILNFDAILATRRGAPEGTAARGPVLDTFEACLDGEVTCLWTRQGGQRAWSATMETHKADLYTDAFSAEDASFNDPGNCLFKSVDCSSEQSTC
jgi:hypothetical protein